MQPVVAVIGAGDASDQDSNDARQVGEGLGAAGITVVCGGLGGVMAAVADGVAAAGGTCIGLLPGTDRAAAHPSLTLALPTGLGEARNALVARAADAVIAIGGEYGTLSEIAFARKLGTPVIGLRTWTMTRHDSTSDDLVRVGSPAEAVHAALAAVGRTA